MARSLTLSICCTLLACSMQAQMPNIVGYEYWFDQNHASRIYVPVTPGTVVDLANAQLNTNGLSLGQHQACFRWKDQPAMGQARWSSVVCRVLHVGQPGPWEITALRYWVDTPVNDTDPLVRYEYFDTPQTVLTYNGQLDLCGYPTGSQTLKFQLRDNHGQWSSVVTRPITINAAGTLGIPTVTASATTSCPGDTVTFTATPQTGPGSATPTGYSWQIPTGNGWIALPSDSSSIVVTIGDASGTVQASATNACGSSQPGSFDVILPDAPDQVAFILGPLQACTGSDATYSVPGLPPGITFIWEITGGWILPPTSGPSVTTTVGSANATISVIAQNACGVQALPRIEDITVTAPPFAGLDGSLSICSDFTPVNLFTGLQGTPDAGGVWRRNGVIVSGIYNPAFDAPGVYTYTVSGSGPCPDATASVTVNESQAPDAGLDGTISLCSNAGVQVMTDALGGTPDEDGSWTGPSATTGLFDPASMTAGVYTYTVLGEPPCGSASATLTISVQQAPNAGMGGTLELCASASPLALINSLTGGPALNGSWIGPDGQPFAGIFTPGQDEEGAYTYTVQGGDACAAASAVLLVNVMELGLTGIDGPLSVPFLETLTYTALPAPADADSIVWTLPVGWEWAPDDLDPYDAVAMLISTTQATAGGICAQAFGGGCTGEVECLDVTVGIDGQNSEVAGVSVFPNPNNGTFTVRLPTTHVDVNLRLLDTTGREVFMTSHRQGLIDFNLPSLPAGAYHLQAHLSDKTIRLPLVICH